LVQTLLLNKGLVKKCTQTLARDVNLSYASTIFLIGTYMGFIQIFELTVTERDLPNDIMMTK